MKHKFLDQYCKDVINYYNAKNVISLFKNTYNEEIKDFKIQQLKSMSSHKGYRNAIAITVEEQDRYYNEIY